MNRIGLAGLLGVVICFNSISMDGPCAKPSVSDPEVKPLSVDQDFLQNTFVAAQGKRSFPIQDVVSQRLAKAFWYLGRVEKIEKPSLYNSYPIVFLKTVLDEASYHAYQGKLNELCNKSQEGTLFKLLDSITLASE
ncbi:hypothetical protein CVU75_01695 [Candidatus Dependentiae bacterium HGW-Dependentiae-1]|nr:MAG: hypothetical protein CVU75_01695 [Candidatus Dependentiae bacterium HGW-Dependentiae-1]